jgi:chromosomal replication initiator protein
MQWFAVLVQLKVRDIIITRKDESSMNAEQAWQATLGQLQMDMSKAAFDTWVRDAELTAYADGLFTIGVKNAYARDWLEGRLSSTITRMLSGMIDRPASVNFTVWQSEPEVTDSEPAVEPEPAVADTSLRFTNQTINSRYTFDNFVVGSSNRLAHAACMAVAENPAHAYNPLFLYGGVGLGKTHLLHAIGNATRNRGLQVLYVSSEEFTNDLINAIRTHTTPAFREKYRRMDVLLIDDIQFIAGKESTQEEFFHTFNTLHGQDKQIVLSSDRPPKALVTLEERLRSRFEWGLTADVQPPDYETRIAILRSKAERGGKKVPGEIHEMIARQVQSNIRELEGALTRVLAYASLSGLPLTPQLVTSALVDLLPQRSSLTQKQVIDVVASAFGLSSERLLGRDRSREVALPRQVAMYLLREEANVSLPQIGEALGGRDHTTVMYACDKVADMLERDDHLRRQVIQIRETLYGRGRLSV